MKKLVFILSLLVSAVCFAQPSTPVPGYTNVNDRYIHLGLAPRSLHTPASSDTTIAAGQWRRAGRMMLDTTGANTGLWIQLNNRMQQLAWKDSVSIELTDSVSNRITSVIRRSDSVFTKVYNTETFAFKDSTGGGGSSYTIGAGLIDSSGTLKLDNRRDIEYISQPTSGSALASGWSEISTPAYTVSDGKFVFSGGANNFTEYIRSDAGVLSEESYVEAYIICNTIGATDQGPRIGWKSYNANGFVHDVHGGYVTGGGATNPNKAVIFGSTGASTSASDSARVAVDGDTLYYRLTRVGIEYRQYVENITQGWKLQKTVTTTPLGVPFVAHNSAYVSVIPGAGAYTVYGLRYVIQAPLFTDIYVVGNSITYGQAATSEASRYASRIGYPALNIGSGGGADVIQSVLTRVGEIIAIRPRKVLLMIGGNDIVFAGSLNSTAKTAYIALRDSLVNNSIEVVHCLPTPRNATDVTALKDFLDTTGTFRSDIIVRGTWTRLLTGASGLLAKYAGDATHPNDAGMGEAAAAINDELHLWPNGSNFNINKNLIAANGYVQGTDAGTGADQFLAGAFIARQSGSSTLYGMFGAVSGYTYVQGINQGTGYTHTVLSPATGSRVGIRETAPTATLDIRDGTAGNAQALNINHQGAYSAEDQELRVDFQNAHSTVTRFANFLGPSTSFGFKFYTYAAGALNATPALTLNGISNLVGINTVSPREILDVNGIISIRNVPATTDVDSMVSMTNGRGNSISATNWGRTASTGITNTAGTWTANLSTGVAGGQSVIGGTAADNQLLIRGSSVASGSTTTNPDITFINGDGAGLTGGQFLKNGTFKVRYLTGTTSIGAMTGGTGAGTTPTLSISGTDIGGTITVTTDTDPALSQVVVTVNFGNTFPAAPKAVMLSPGNSNAAALTGVTQVFVNQAGITTGKFDIVSGSTALAATTQYIWYYSVIL